VRADRATDRLDARSVRGAALRTAWQVAAVSAAVMLAILGLAALYILDQSRPTELLEKPAPGETKIYVGAHEVLLALVVLAVFAVVVLGGASWVISRRAVAPLGAALRMQREFVADASHELRTPLTVLDTRLQLLTRKLARDEPYAGTLEAARRDTRTMIELVTDLLLVAEASATEADGIGCDLRPTVLSSVQDLQLLAAERAVRIATSVDQEARVGLSQLSLRRALVVLIDNALAHSPDGGVVEVLAGVDRGRAVVRVVDHGPGIDGVEVDQIFERFAHGPATGQRRSFGIGLSLVRDLAARHGGGIAVESTSEDGTTMRLELPVLR
jgi:two-component system OmpR family sensor kinase